MSLGAPTTKPHAISKMVIGPDGQMKTIYVDPQTGQEVQGLDGYNVIQNNDQDLNFINPTKDTTAPTVAKQFASPRIDQLPMHGERAHDPSGSRIDPRDATNNFGYISKPGWASALSALPGIPGIAAKAANLGVNYSNNEATDRVRNMLGLPETTRGETARNTLRGTQGQVADVNIGNNIRSIGFEAQTPEGITNFTPEEAQRHAAAVGKPLSLADPTADKQRKKDFAKENPGAAHGIFGTLKNDLHSFFSSLFDGDQKNSTNNSFPDAPQGKPNEGMGTGKLPDFAGPWGGGTRGYTGYGPEGESGQSIGPSGGGYGWGGPH